MLKTDKTDVVRFLVISKLIPVFTIFSLGCSMDISKKLSEELKENPSLIGERLFSCPDNYVYIVDATDPTVAGFCVAKYEMKDVAGVATSQAAGTPWGNIDRNDAIAACQAIGSDYDLISNEQWNKISQNIGKVAVNWSNGVVASGALNRGHYNDDNGWLLSAENDEHPCYDLDLDEDGNSNSESSLTAVCNPAIWNSHRRTHQLGSGKVLWDFSGNSWEWLKDDFSDPGASSNDYLSDIVGLNNNFVELFAPPSPLLCADPNSNDYCGFGFAWISSPGGAVARGGSLYNGTDTGIFAVDLDNSPSYSNTHVGFRCVAEATAF